MGLWFRTAMSYVLVTLGAVLLVETVLIGIYAPRVIGAKVDEQAVLNEVRNDDTDLALKLSNQISATDGAGLPGAVPMATPGPGQAPTPASTATAQFLPDNRGPCDAGELFVLLDNNGTVLESSPDCYPAHRPAHDLLGADAGPFGGSGIDTGRQGRVAWARAPLVQAPPGTFNGGNVSAATDLVKIPGAHQIGTLYTQRPTAGATQQIRFSNIRPLLVPGLVVLAGAVPVGLLFGYVSMRRPVRRLRRLAATTQALADGNLDQRIEVTGRDELSQLEADVNRMAERLSASMARERALVETRTRSSERERIARDLHDSVSQDLFSLRLLAGGVARALPSDSPLQQQLRQLQATATAATHEMQAMLLQLRPAALAGNGLPAALEHLARTYRQRVGILVRTELADIELAAPREEALLRIAQEALANAVRHGDPSEVTLSLDGERLVIHDNGHGFDPTTPTVGMGLTLMTERAAEVDAVLTVTSSPGAGTTVEVHLT